MVPPLTPEAKSFNIRSLLLKATFALGLTFFMAQVNLEYLESYFYDLRVRLDPARPSPGPIELIYIRPDTIETFKGLPSADAQKNLLLRLIQAGAKAIVYEFDIKEIPGTTDQKNDWEQSIVENKNVYVAGRGAPFKGEENQLQLPQPLEQVSLTPAPKTADISNFAKDGVTRRMMLTYQGSALLPITLASLINPDIKKVENIRGRFDFYGTDQAYIDFLPAKSYPASTFQELSAEQSELSRFKDKIIFIGTDLSQKEDEYIKSPFNREVVAMTLSELQANVVDTLIRNSAPLKTPSYLKWLFILIASVLATHVVLTMKPTQGLVVLGGAIAGFITLSCLAFWLFNWWLPMAAPLLAVILCYYFFIPYRLIVENRRSWEYFQKNKLLSQVEELKTNFISMMSHDLKTPIARIQGMTDMILTDPVKLSSQQREAVDTIKHSADDLLKFINAILNYGKIESQGVQLHLQSKDLNSLLNEVIRKHEFLAKVKHIQIITELEPLFPVPVDADLMKQVFSNLIENAIKYSPEGTKILISSEEKGSAVVIQVADQGPGIPADELPNIFMKFFRSKNAKSSPIKGSGLGLYLAKYFTELHHGRIFVESSHGHGSTFTVELPMEQGGTHA